MPKPSVGPFKKVPESGPSQAAKTPGLCRPDRARPENDHGTGRPVRDSRQKDFEGTWLFIPGGRGVPFFRKDTARTAAAIGVVLGLLMVAGAAYWPVSGLPLRNEPNAAGDLILTEVRDEPAGQVFIEIANRAGRNLNRAD